jgi:hypothetical protein
MKVTIFYTQHLVHTPRVIYSGVKYGQFLVDPKTEQYNTEYYVLNMVNGAQMLISMFGVGRIFTELDDDVND